MANTTLIRKKLRLFRLYFCTPLRHLIIWAHRFVPNSQCRCIGGLQLVGPAVLVAQSANILEEFKSSSPALYDALTGKDQLVFMFVPGLKKGSIGTRFVDVGDDYLKWHDFGIRAKFVYIAYYVQNKLIVPSIRMDDYYDNQSVLNKQAALQTSRWLADHQQPDEWVQYFASYSTKR